MELEDYLSALKGQGSRDSEGVFTLNLSRALAKMREMALNHPYDFVLRAIQSGVASGAERVSVTLGKGSLTITHDGVLGEMEDLLAWLTGAREGLSRAQTHLAMGLAIAPLRWDLQVGSTLVSRREEHLTSTSLSSPLNLLRWEVPIGKSTAEQFLPVLSRARHSPVAVEFQGKNLFAPWLSSFNSPYPQSQLGDPADLFCSLELCELGGFLLPSLPKEEMNSAHGGYVWKGRQGLFRKETGFPERRPAWYVELHGSSPPRRNRWNCRRAIRRPLYDVGPAQVQFIIDGVALPSEEVGALSNLEILEHADWAKTDLSGRRVVRDEAYQGFLEELTETTLRLQSSFSQCWHNVTRVARGKLGAPSPAIRQKAFEALGLVIGSTPCQEFHAPFLTQGGRIPIASFGHRGPYLALHNAALEYLSVHPCQDQDHRALLVRPAEPTFPIIPLLDVLWDRKDRPTEYALVLPFHNLPSFEEIRWKLPLLRQLQIAAQLVTTLELLHQDQGYGYLTPGRILVGPNDTVRLQNPELSRIEQEFRQHIAMNTTSPSYEDLAYLCPEEVVDSKKPDPKGKDLYRAGVLLRETLLGVPTDLGPQPPLSYLFRLLQEPSPNVSKECPGYPEELTAMVTRMLDKTPLERSVPLGRLAELLALEAQKMGLENSSENL